MVSKPKQNHGMLGRIVLSVVATAGVVGIAAIAPGALALVGVGMRLSQRRSRNYYPADVRRAVKGLQRRGLIRLYSHQGDMQIKVTEAGRTELLKYELQEKSLQQKKWDGKWRLIIFDIEERRRGARDRIRKELRSFGLVKLQESVWAYPYDCEEVVTLLKAENRVSRNVLYVVAGEIEGDAQLKRQFGL